MKKRVLLVDMLNLFYRSYIVDPSLSNGGYPIGGVTGSMKSLQKLFKEIRPDEVVLCWDGDGGSAKRKKLDPNYKAGRAPIRLNRNVKNLTDDEEMQNKVWQQTRLIEYLNMFPMPQLKFKGTEADDVIAHLSTHPFYEDWRTIIVSSDKDFYQMCSPSTIVYRPLNRKDKDGKRLPNQFVSTISLLEEHSIHPKNFALARALAGDKSDNLDGVGGVGLKTAAKRFPMLKDKERCTIKTLVEHSKAMNGSRKKEIKAYSNVIDNEDLLARNYQMMQLYIPSMGAKSKGHVDLVLNEYEFAFNKTKTVEMMISDGIGSTNLGLMFAHFNRLVAEQKNR